MKKCFDFITNNSSGDSDSETDDSKIDNNEINPHFYYKNPYTNNFVFFISGTFDVKVSSKFSKSKKKKKKKKKKQFKINKTHKIIKFSGLTIIKLLWKLEKLKMKRTGKK